MRRWAAAQDVTREVRPPQYAGGHHVESVYPEVIGPVSALSKPGAASGTDIGRVIQRVITLTQ
jgi:hypothetical protein